MDEHRRYAEEPDSGRYSGTSPYESGVHQRPDGAYRLPDRRPDDQQHSLLAGDFSRSANRDPADQPAGDPAPAPSRTALDAIRVPLRPTEYPAVRPAGQPRSSWLAPPTTSSSGGAAAPTSSAAGASAPTSPAYHEPTTPVPPITSRLADRSGSDAVYRTRRPASAIIVALVTALLMVPVVRLLVEVAFVDPPTVRGIVPAVLLTLGLPLTGLGLYGAAGAGGAVDRGALLRPPAGYLPVGLVLLVAAALATA